MSILLDFLIEKYLTMLIVTVSDKNARAYYLKGPLLYNFSAPYHGKLVCLSLTLTFNTSRYLSHGRLLYVLPKILDKA